MQPVLYICELNDTAYLAQLNTRVDLQYLYFIKFALRMTRTILAPQNLRLSRHVSSSLASVSGASIVGKFIEGVLDPLSRLYPVEDVLLYILRFFCRLEPCAAHFLLLSVLLLTRILTALV